MQLSGVGRRIGVGLAVAAMAAAPSCVKAQVLGRPGAYAGLDAHGEAQTVEAALRAMSEQATVVFVGTVVSVTRVGGDGFAAPAGMVEIAFAVERPVRGCAGGSYTLREWGGLWPGASQRYRPGTRLLMLLHAPGASGLSSPVGGMDGAIPVRASSGLVTSADGTQTVNAPVADLRWLAARLVRGTGYSKPGAKAGAVLPAARPRALVTAPAAGGVVSPLGVPATAGAAGISGSEGQAQTQTVASESVSGIRSASTPAASASVETVLGMMAGWAKETGDAR